MDIEQYIKGMGVYKEVEEFARLHQETSFKEKTSETYIAYNCERKTRFELTSDLLKLLWFERQAERKLEEKSTINIKPHKKTEGELGKKEKPKKQDIYGYDSVTPSMIQYACGISGTNNIAIYFLFDCCFLEDVFAQKYRYRIPGLYDALTNKYVLTMMLEYIVQRIIEDETKYAMVEMQYVQDKILISQMVKRIDEKWLADEVQLELSFAEYERLVYLLFDGNVVWNDGYVDAFECNGENETDADMYADVCTEKWDNLIANLTEKYADMKRILKFDEEYVCEVVDDNEKDIQRFLKMPRYLMPIFAGLMTCYRKLPLCVETNLKGARRSGEETNKRNNEWKSKRFMPIGKFALEPSRIRAFDRMVRYLEYSEEMDMRRFNEKLLEEYFYSMYVVAYYLSQEKSYQQSSINAFENMFGLYLSKLEIEKIAACFYKLDKDDGFNEVANGFLYQVLHRIWKVKSPLLKVYIVETMLDEILSDFQKKASINTFTDFADKIELTEFFVNKWGKRIQDLEHNYLNADAILNNSQIKTLLGEKELTIKSQTVQKYETFYSGLISNAEKCCTGQRSIDEGWQLTFSSKQCEEYSQRLREEIVKDTEEISRWVIMCNLGILENRKIMITDC